MERSDPTVNWVLESGDPSIQYLALTELLDEPLESKEASALRERIPDGPIVKKLLDGQESDGGFGNHPYAKWTGAHWRLICMVELGVPPGCKPAVRATDGVLDWLVGEDHIQGIKKINGLTRRCASQEGNALAVCSRLGLANDPRVRQIAQSLVLWQWPDGGWNCDREEDVKHSSFNESLSTLWGLTEFSLATGDTDTRMAADRAAEFFLKHRIFRSCHNDQERPPETFHGEFRALPPWTQVHYPAYWHYDILQALMILSRAGRLKDPRANDALDLVASKRDANGLWSPEGYYWHGVGGEKVVGEIWNASKKEWEKILVSSQEVVDWGRDGPNKMITLNALRVLKAAGRLS